jgi:uncharacterized protein YeaO (DUF488 family)
MIQTKRVYDPPASTDGVRVLVDRLWPRGCKKEEVRCHAWLREVAPSSALRQWFGHDPNKWEEFRQRYLKELQTNPQQKAALQKLLSWAREGNLTLVYSAKDVERNQATVLKEWLEKEMTKQRAP